MTALIEDLEICLVAANDADEYVRLVSFAEVVAKTALTVLNCFHSRILRCRS